MKQVFCRHRRLYIWLLADLALLASYLLLRGNRACMNAAAGFPRPLRAALGRLSYLVDFSVMEVLCEGYDSNEGCYVGRTYADSVDIDGRVLFTAAGLVPAGEFVWVRLTGVSDGDLTGEIEG